MRLVRFVIIFVLVSIFTAPAHAGAVDRVNWEKFLGRHDLVWDRLPKRWEDGPFDGNGRFGTVFFQDSDNSFQWRLGHVGVVNRGPAHRGKPPCINGDQLGIGNLILQTAGKIESGTMRLNLWNAETVSEIKTDKGTIKLRALTHATDRVVVIELDAAGGEKDAFFYLEDERNAKVTAAKAFSSLGMKNGQLWVRPHTKEGKGEYTVAWREKKQKDGKRLLFLTIHTTFPENTTVAEVTRRIETAERKSLKNLLKLHRDWWHAYYPKSFVSVPDPRVETFYWIQIYKLACATREDGFPCTTLGPWWVSTWWPRMFNDMNTQSFYAPIYTANRLELGGSLDWYFQTNRKHFDLGADKAMIPWAGSIYGPWSRRGCPDTLVWLLHNYYSLYKYSMDHERVVNQDKYPLFPLLKKGVNGYLSLLRKEADGKYHLPRMKSPELGSYVDCNFQLTKLRWGLQTLLELSERYQIKDEMIPRWKDAMENLVEFQYSDVGYLMGRQAPIHVSHRHWHHLNMVYPFYLLDLDDPVIRERVDKSVDFWRSRPDRPGIKEKWKARSFRAWSAAAAASIYASVGKGDKALEMLHYHHDNRDVAKNIMPNTMYLEVWPVIECSTVAARSLQDMMLLSHQGIIRVFPAVPSAWKNAVFRDYRAEGAFLVSGVYKDGRTRWVRIKSLAGEPCVVRAGLGKNPKAEGIGSSKGVKLTSRGNSTWEIDLKKGEEVLLRADGYKGSCVIQPLPVDPKKCNHYGINRNNKTDDEYDALIKSLEEKQWSPLIGDVVH